MKFSVGDKIKFKRDSASGYVTSIYSDFKLIIMTNDGFEIKVSNNEVVKIDDETDKILSYGTHFENKDYKEKKVSKVFKRQKKLTSLKVDLHIENITSNFSNMHNDEIIDLQLNQCVKSLENALNTNNIHSLVIVHGIGSGVLMNRVHDILDSYNLRYYLSSDSGSTKVML